LKFADRNATNFLCDFLDRKRSIPNWYIYNLRSWTLQQLNHISKKEKKFFPWHVVDAVRTWSLHGTVGIINKNIQ
jgi:hypothetical protein